MIPSSSCRRTAFLALSLAGLLGCSDKRGNQPLSPTEERLYTIGKAYIHATSRLGRPPKNFGELKPSVEGTAPDDLLRSPTDGEEFVVIWGVDFNKLPPGSSDPYYVGAYEKTGSGGQRFVLRFPIAVVSMNEEKFRKAVFPPGHKPPL